LDFEKTFLVDVRFILNTLKCVMLQMKLQLQHMIIGLLLFVCTTTQHVFAQSESSFGAGNHSTEGYKEVYQFFEQCTLMKVDAALVEAGFMPTILKDECTELFAENYVSPKFYPLQDFNQLWIEAGGESVLSEKPKQTLNYEKCISPNPLCSFLDSTQITAEKSTDKKNKCPTFEERLKCNQLQERLSTTESQYSQIVYQVKPGIMGVQSRKKFTSSLRGGFKFIFPFIYSDLVACYGRSNNTARLLRELASKQRFLATYQASFKLRTYMLMYQPSHLRPENTDECKTLRQLVDEALPDLISNFKKKLAVTPSLKMKCKSWNWILTFTNGFKQNDYSDECAEHYTHNFERINSVVTQ